MGNYASCTFVFVPPLMMKKTTKFARVIFPTGQVKQYREPVSVAELMLECPHHFLADSRSLRIAHRFSPLAADEDLELGNVYVFFHMRRANSVVTAADMAMLFVAESMAVKRLSGGDAAKSRVLLEICGRESWQEMAVERTIPRLSLDGVDLGFQYGKTYDRSRKPVLETINEEPILFMVSQ